jgi:hypothetical protein
MVKDLSRDGREILIYSVRMQSCGSGYSQAQGYHKLIKEPTCSIKGREFLES